MSFHSGDHHFERIAARTTASGAVYFVLSHSNYLTEDLQSASQKGIYVHCCGVVLRKEGEQLYGKFCNIKNRKKEARERDSDQ